ncbi:MAG: hypothetical protein M1827_005039 [Pycnora praestabilis]|nr:MAG: hypothetical protein M1827_005039 [Pycnora praestabilis]
MTNYSSGLSTDHEEDYEVDQPQSHTPYGTPLTPPPPPLDYEELLTPEIQDGHGAEVSNSDSDKSACATLQNSKMTSLSMQDRQARGKRTGEKSAEDQDDRFKVTDDLFEERERRHRAARILESNELLIFHAHANNESIPQTRLRFEKMMIGMEDSEEEWEDTWDSDHDDEDKAPQHGTRSTGGSSGGSGSGIGIGSSKARGKGVASKKRAAR